MHKHRKQFHRLDHHKTQNNRSDYLRNPDNLQCLLMPVHIKPW